MHFFVIDLHHRNMDFIVFILVGVFCNSVKDFFTRYWDDTLNYEKGLPCWLHSLPSNRTFLSQSVHKRTNSNDTHPMHFAKFRDPLAQIHVVGLHTYRIRLYIFEKVLKISIFLNHKFVMWPKRIVKSKVSMFVLRVLGIE